MRKLWREARNWNNKILHGYEWKYHPKTKIDEYSDGSPYYHDIMELTEKPKRNKHKATEQQQPPLAKLWLDTEDGDFWEYRTWLEWAETPMKFLPDNITTKIPPENIAEGMLFATMILSAHKPAQQETTARKELNNYHKTEEAEHERQKEWFWTSNLYGKEPTMTLWRNNKKREDPSPRATIYVPIRCNSDNRPQLELREPFENVVTYANGFNEEVELIELMELAVRFAIAESRFKIPKKHKELLAAERKLENNETD
jgi:hypothetical protein